MRSKPSICFVAPNIYPILSGRLDLKHIGGAEIQQTIIARELIHRNYSVSFITWDYGQPDAVVHDGIRVYKMCTAHDGIPGLRFIHPRWTCLWQAMSKANADIYYQRNAGIETGQAAIWCRKHDRHFIYAVAGEPDCQRNHWRLKKYRERILFRYGLHHADCIITQTHVQQEMLRKGLGLDSVIVRNCCHNSCPIDFNRPKSLEIPRLLWLGRITRQKALDHLLNLAEILPEYQFDIVGDSNNKSVYAQRIIEKAKTMKNVLLHGYIPHSQVDQYYNRAWALLCTSDWEGYPNTFIEAWSRGIPVATRWDADNVVSQNGLGVFEKNTALMARKLQDLFQSPNEWEACSRRARNYYLQNHTVQKNVDAIEDIFNQWFHNTR